MEPIHMKWKAEELTFCGQKPKKRRISKTAPMCRKCHTFILEHYKKKLEAQTKQTQMLVKAVDEYFKDKEAPAVKVMDSGWLNVDGLKGAALKMQCHENPTSNTRTYRISLNAKKPLKKKGK